MFKYLKLLFNRSVIVNILILSQIIMLITIIVKLSNYFIYFYIVNIL